MSKSYHWIKLWNEIIHDPKMGRLPDNLWRRFIECCLMANEMNMGGRLPPIHDIAWNLRIEEEALRGEFDTLARIGLLDFVNTPLDEHWIVVNFDKRQDRMTAAERMRRKRQYDKSRKYYEVSDEPVTERNTEGEVEVEEDKEVEVEVEVEVDKSNGEPFGQLLDVFVKETDIPEMLMNKGDTDTIRKWVKAGYTPSELEQAIREMQDKDFTILRPKSIDSALRIVRSKNKNLRTKQPQYNREAERAAFLAGED